MKSILNSQNLFSALKKLKSIIGSNDVLPILGNVKMSFYSGVCYLTGTDLQTCKTLSFPCDGEDQFTFCVPFDVLLGWCKGVTESIPLFFFYKSLKEGVSIRYFIGRIGGEIRLKVEDSEDFPRTLEITSPDVSIAVTKEIASSFKKASKFVMKDRFSNSVMVRIGNGKCEVIGTNGLAYYSNEFDCDYRGKTKNVFVPIDVAKNVCVDSEMIFSFGVESTLIGIRVVNEDGSEEITCSRANDEMASTFYKIRTRIEKEPVLRCNVHAEDFFHQMTTFSKHKDLPLNIHLNGEIKLWNEKGESNLYGNLPDGDLNMQVNPKLFAELCKLMSPDTTLSFTENMMIGKFQSTTQKETFAAATIN